MKDFIISLYKPPGVTLKMDMLWLIENSMQPKGYCVVIKPPHDDFLKNDKFFNLNDFFQWCRNNSDYWKYSLVASFLSSRLLRTTHNSPFIGRGNEDIALGIGGDVTYKDIDVTRLGDPRYIDMLKEKELGFLAIRIGTAGEAIPVFGCHRLGAKHEGIWYTIHPKSLGQMVIPAIEHDLSNIKAIYSCKHCYADVPISEDCDCLSMLRCTAKGCNNILIARSEQDLNVCNICFEKGWVDHKPGDISAILSPLRNHVPNPHRYARAPQRGAFSNLMSRQSPALKPTSKTYYSVF